MSHILHETVNITDAGIGTVIFLSHYLFSTAAPPYPPPLAQAQAQAPQGVSDFVDGSGPIFSMYLEMATEGDRKMAENWQKDADGILIFVRLHLLVGGFTP